MNTVLHILWKVVWLVAIFALLAFGLGAVGLNIFETSFVMNNLWVVMVLQWAALIAGVLGLVALVKCLVSGTHGGALCGCGGHSAMGHGGNGMRKVCPGCGMANCNCR